MEIFLLLSLCMRVKKNALQLLNQILCNINGLKLQWFNRKRQNEIWHSNIKTGNYDFVKELRQDKRRLLY